MRNTFYIEVIDERQVEVKLNPTSFLNPKFLFLLSENMLMISSSLSLINLVSVIFTFNDTLCSKKSNSGYFDHSAEIKTKIPPFSILISFPEY